MEILRLIANKQVSKESSNSLNLDLDLPVGTDFRSKKIPISMELMIQLSEERLPLVYASWEAARKRTVSSVRVPFEL